MNARIVYISLTLLALTLGGCSTTSPEHAGYAGARPILSAADATSMIRVEVRVLEPVFIEQAVVASANHPSDPLLAE